MKDYRSSKRKPKVRYSKVVSRTPEAIKAEKKRLKTAEKNWKDN